MDNDRYSGAFKGNDRAKRVFDYLQALSPIKKIYPNIENSDNKPFDLNEKYGNVKQYLSSKSALFKYLNPPNSCQIKLGEMPIFPFEFNGSQETATRIALNNDFSIIQGPPGTGKTQVILNIITNLVLNEKSVLVVSNSNDAIKNVKEKLEKADLGFLTATLGKKENKDSFFEKTQLDNQKYKGKKLLEWKELPIIDKNKLQIDLERLNEYFNATTRSAELKMKLSELDTEYTNFKKNLSIEISPSKKTLRISSVRITKQINKLFVKHKNEVELSNIYKLVLKYVYGIVSENYKDISYISAIETFKYALYQKEIACLHKKIEKEELIITEYEKGNKKSLKTLCCESMDYLKKALATRLENQEFRVFNNLKTEFEDFLKYYPIVFSTTYSAFDSKGGKLYDYLIMDEASQVDLVTGALALSCAKRAVIVGDEKQLANIINDSLKKGETNVKTEKQKMEEVYNNYRAEIPSGYCYDKSFLSSVIEVFENSNCKIGNTLLREHYRCNPKIINFCNKQFYDNQLIIMTKEDENDKHDAICIRLNSNRKSTSNRMNQREVEILEKAILPNLTNEEQQNDKLAIITPYNNQVNLIKDMVGITPSTVHKYQGQERDNVIISTVDDKITPFADDKRLLNVAISRAKKKLFLVNSYSEEDRYRSNIGTFIDYAKNNNFDVKEETKVNSIFDFLYSRLNEEKIKYSKDPYTSSKKYKGLSVSEIAMYECLDEIIKSDEKYKYLKFVFGYPIYDIVLKTESCYSIFTPAEKRYIENGAHVDFCIFNKVSGRILLGIEVDGVSYHNTEKTTYNRSLKTSILEKLGIKFQAFSTIGSGEKEKLEDYFNSFSIKEEKEE